MNGQGVFSSLYTGTLISTFLPLRARILAARVGNLMCGFAISSGTNCERSLGPDTGYAGVVQSDRPSRGKVVSVIGYSSFSMWSLAIVRLHGGSVSWSGEVPESKHYRHFMLGSTSRRSLKPIPHGFPGVASSMNRPNSG